MPGVLDQGICHSITFLKGTVGGEVWKCVKVLDMIKYVHIHVYVCSCGGQRLELVIVAQGYSTLFFVFVFMCRKCKCTSNVCGEHMHKCACLHMCTCMWKPGVNVKCHPQSLSTLYTEPESLLHRAQLYWNSGQPASFRDILSPFLLHWDYIQATTPI